MDEIDTIISKIVEKTKLTKEEVKSKIVEKEEEFGGMVSTVGAAYIVGKELGVDLVKPISKELKIGNIVKGMSKVNVIGKVVYVSDIRTFKKDDLEGKVATIIFGDETGKARISLWNEQTESLDRIEAGQIIEIINGYVKDEYNGMCDIRLGRYGNIRLLNNEDYNIDVKEDKVFQTKYEKKFLCEIKEGDFVKTEGYITKLFEKTVVYEVCPTCNKKLDSGKCKEHGSVEPDLMVVVSGIFDDGTDTINITFFRKAAEYILGMESKLIDKKVKEKGEKGFFSDVDVNGSFLSVSGVVKLNSYTGTKELYANNVKKPDVVGSINSMINKIEG